MEEKAKGLYYGSMKEGGQIKEHFVSEIILNQNGYFQKSDLEFSRYKQDCRKRALDLASSDNEKLNGASTADTVITLADKYYQWLIEIPQ